MSGKFRKVLFTFLVPVILFVITACPGLVIDHIQIDFGPGGAVVGATGTFTCISPVSGNIVTYRWSFGDGTIAEGETAVHSYASSGNFIVECRIITVDSVLIFTKTITIEPSGSPEMDLQRPALTSIPDGGTDNLGSLSAGQTLHSFTYTIENTGNGTLTVSTPTASGFSNVADFSVTSPPAGSILAGGSTTFTIQFRVPISLTNFSFELEIGNNDADEDPYNITISGFGLT